MNHSDYLALNDSFRTLMIQEFEAEKYENPQRFELLSIAGKMALPELIRTALREGNSISLMQSLLKPQFWEIEKSGGLNDIPQLASRLALSEFNTWYVAAFSRRYKGLAM